MGSAVPGARGGSAGPAQPCPLRWDPPAAPPGGSAGAGERWVLGAAFPKAFAQNEEQKDSGKV